MKKLFVYLLFMLPLAIASCGGDDKDEPTVVPNNPSTETYQIYEFTFGAGSGNSCTLLTERTHAGWGFLKVHFGHDGVDMDNNPRLRFDNSTDGSARFLDFGKVSDLSSIKKLPTTGWTSNGTFPMKLNEGYVIELYESNSFLYYRLYVEKFVYSVSGDIVGITIKYQQFIPS